MVTPYIYANFRVIQRFPSMWSTIRLLCPLAIIDVPPAIDRALGATLSDLLMLFNYQLILTQLSIVRQSLPRLIFHIEISPIAV
jgi:hypothetical protein